MRRYSYTAEKAKQEIDAFLEALELPKLPPEEAREAEAKPWSGAGDADHCTIRGKLTVGKGSRAVSCYIHKGADVVIGDNCLVMGSTFGGKTEIGNDCKVVRSTFNSSAKIGNGSKVLLSTIDGSLVTGPRCLAKNLAVVVNESLSHILVGADAVLYRTMWDGDLTAGDRFILCAAKRGWEQETVKSLSVPSGLVAGSDVRLEFTGKLSARAPVHIGSGTIVQSVVDQKQVFSVTKLDIRNNVRFVLAFSSTGSSSAGIYGCGNLFVDDNAEVYVTQAVMLHGLTKVTKSTVVAI